MTTAPTRPDRPPASSYSRGSSRRSGERRGILIVGNFLSGSNANRQMCEELADVLSGAGWPVITTSDRPGRASRAVDMVTAAWARRHDYSVAHVDVFSGLSFFWAEAVCSVLTGLGKPYVLTLRGGSLPDFAARWPGRTRRLLGGAAVVTTPSRFLLEAMAPYRRELLLLPNPIKIDQYPFRLRTDPRPRLVWLRAFHRIYNPALAPRVLDLLKPAFPDVTLAMVGPDKKDGAYEEVQRVARQLGVSDLLSLPGAVGKRLVPAALAEHDVFLNTTDVDNTPVSVIEALACGLCVVSTDVGGISYLLDHETDALLVPPDDAPSMASAVERILREKGLSTRLSRNARTKAEACDWSRVLPQWERLFQGLG